MYVHIYRHRNQYTSLLIYYELFTPFVHIYALSLTTHTHTHTHTHRRNLSADSDILIVSRASQLIDDEWMKVDIRNESIATEDDLEAVEAFQRKQLYLLVARCISYAFNTKHQIETSPPKQKLNAERYRLITHVLDLILSGERCRSQETFLTHQEQVTSRDQGFLTCLQWFFDTLSERQDVKQMCVDGQFSVKELESIFSARAKKQVT